eukprot:34291_1
MRSTNIGNFIVNITENVQNPFKMIKDIVYDNDALTKEYDLNEYSFGYPFKYWIQSTCHNKWYVTPKYDNFKQEILQQNDQSIEITVFNTQQIAAMDYLSGAELKKLTAKEIWMLFLHAPRLYQTDLKDGDPLHVEHVLSILFYCNFDILSAKFSQTYRKYNKNESAQELIQKHRKYHHWAKRLWEAVNIYGYDTDHQAFGDYVYHGINQKMLFKSIVTVINGPCSTTSDREVAFNFTAHDGIILTLYPYFFNDAGFCNFFNCCILSDFAAESERLVVQTRLKIVDIYDVGENKGLEDHCNLVALLNKMSGGVERHISGTKEKEPHIVKSIKPKLIKQFMKDKKLSSEYDYPDKFTRYALDQIKTVDFDLHLMNMSKDINDFGDHQITYYGYKKFSKIFIQPKTNIILFDNFIKLFKHLNILHIFNDQSFSLTLTTKLLSSIVTFFSSSRCLLSSFKALIIEKPNEKTMTVSQFIQQFNTQLSLNKMNTKYIAKYQIYPFGPTKQKDYSLCILNKSKLTCIDSIIYQVSTDKFDMIRYKTELIVDEGGLKHMFNVLATTGELLDNWNVDTDRNGNSFLLTVQENNYIECMKLLIEMGADLNIQDKNGKGALIFAIIEGNLEVLKLLIENGANINITDKHGITPLMAAVLSRQINCVKMLVEHNANVNLKNKVGATALMHSLDKGYNEITKIIMQSSDIDLSITDNFDRHALLIAIAFGNIECTKLFIKRGVNVDWKASKGLNALQLSIWKGYTNIVEWLIQANADINIKNDLGATPLMYAVEGQLACTKILVNYKANLHEIDLSNRNALYYSCKYGDVETTSLLLECNAQVNIKENDDGYTPFLVATSRNHLEIAKLLIKYKANINAKDSKNRTALILASSNGHLKMVQFLLSLDIDINNKDVNQDDALSHSFRQGYSHVTKLLLGSNADMNSLQNLCDCSCGTKLQCIKSVINSYCNICNESCLNEIVFQCPNGKNKVCHPNGYILCIKCGSYKFFKANNDYNTVFCVCGMRMRYVEAKSAYSMGSQVSCSICFKVFSDNQMIYNCPYNVNIKHKFGYDSCSKCAVSVDNIEEKEKEKEKQRQNDSELDDFEYNNELEQIKNIMNVNNNDNNKVNLIKEILSQNGGDVEATISLLFN